MALEVAATSALVLPLQSSRDLPQTGQELTRPDRPVCQLLCAAKDPERGCITAMDPAFCVSNQETQGFFPFCAAESAVTFTSPLASFPGAFCTSWAQGMARGEGAACDAVPESIIFPLEKETASLHVFSTLLHVSGMNPGHFYQDIKGLQESEVK